MNIFKINSKLRKFNYSKYILFAFSLTLSSLLVSSYGVMFLSPTVQNILPASGDSNKQAYMLYYVAIIGCMFFTSYSYSLFLKYKSKDIGILLSLGAKKTKIKRILYTELLTNAVCCSIVGLVLSIPVSYLIWKAFQFFIIDSREMTYHIGYDGFIYGLIFCLVCTILLIFKTARFINHSNIIDTIRSQHKCETVKLVKPWYGVLGGIFIIGGLFLGYGVPIISIRHYSYCMPGIWSLTYLFCIVGLYMLISFCVIYNQKGKNLKKYYSNIIPKSMMKFTGKQTVKSMCVISLLISGGLFASFYTPSLVTRFFYNMSKTPYNYSFHYRLSENLLTQNDIDELADKYNIKINDYNEVSSISLIGSGLELRSISARKYDYVYKEKYETNEFFRLSDFNKVANMDLKLLPGQYYTIIISSMSESRFRRFNDLNKATNPINDTSIDLSYKGNVEFSPFVIEGTYKYVISDKDYDLLVADLPEKNIETFVLFNVPKQGDNYSFAKEFRDEIITRSSKDVAKGVYYNEYRKIRYLKEGKEYGNHESINLSCDNNQLFLSWKYYPKFSILNKQDLLKNMAVYLMLFIYISIICFVAVGVISYTRCITIATNSKALFKNLKRLGANTSYINKCIKNQLKKIFILPMVFGSIMPYMFFVFITFGDGSIISSDYLVLGINLITILLAAIYVYGLYRFSLRKFKEVITN
ncbi:ABC transporter permease [Clostridiaceae bacterium M8S5]|nr:ABC transporter permease [Clostridiaceae bacterium M8S5]